MDTRILGLHHVTAIAGDPQRNRDFYTGVLGMRLVKRTVNYDDPTTYHLYFGDDVGHPGTILTFFAWPGARQGQPGARHATSVSLSISTESIDYWIGRLQRLGIPVERPITRFNEHVITLGDPDGLPLELVAHANADAGYGWPAGPVPPIHSIRGLHSVTVTANQLTSTANFLVGDLGFRSVGQYGDRHRFQVGFGHPGAWIDVIVDPGASVGAGGRGTIHHVAWRLTDSGSQKEWHKEMASLGLNISDIMDRTYFQSIYFREPGGVLFELATDPPGFMADEERDALGEHLKLPRWLERYRPRIETSLPRLDAAREPQET